MKKDCKNDYFAERIFGNPIWAACLHLLGNSDFRECVPQRSYMDYLIPKNWDKYQHYKSRRPPWIKLYRDLLDDIKFHQLPDENKVVLIYLWLIASDDENGVIHNDSNALAFRLHRDSNLLALTINSLISGGWFIASNTLAECLQHAIPETEKRHIREEKKVHDFEKIKSLLKPKAIKP